MGEQVEIEADLRGALEDFTRTGFVTVAVHVALDLARILSANDAHEELVELATRLRELHSALSVNTSVTHEIESFLASLERGEYDKPAASRLSLLLLELFPRKEPIAVG